MKIYMHLKKQKKIQLLNQKILKEILYLIRQVRIKLTKDKLKDTM